MLCRDSRKYPARTWLTNTIGMGIWTKNARKDFAGEANRKYKSQFLRKKLTSALNMLFSRFYHTVFLTCFVGWHMFYVPLQFGS